MSIRRLPSELINRIAAGEVVERPASALKELVENALDAGAANVAIRLSAGGLDLVEVTDDGSGMAPSEMSLALERHATSKLPDDAIELVSSFGFRGEALPSIASVSRLALESRPPGSDGWRIEIDHGVRITEGPAAVPPGTRVRVEGLFDKVPARRKFLRSPRAEYAASLDSVKRLAMARPDVAFSLEHDGRPHATDAGRGPRRERKQAVRVRASRLARRACPQPAQSAAAAAAGSTPLATSSS